MLGDNTRKSDDGRTWRWVKYWVNADGSIAPPEQGVRSIVGNFRAAHSPTDPVDPDENPVVVDKQNKIVLTDLWGEEHVIDGTFRQSVDWRRVFADGADGPVRFVPQRYFLGRAFARFWPANPFGWFRVGLIR
jgi:hypothetical protein